MVLDQLDQGVGGTFHGNTALHNGLQKERCSVLAGLGTAASRQVTAGQKISPSSIMGSQLHLCVWYLVDAVGVLTGVLEQAALANIQ